MIGTPSARLAGNFADQITRTVPVPSLAQLHDAANETRAALLWLVDARARPGEDALEALLAADAMPAVSLPIDDRGAAIERLIGRFADSDSEALLEAVRNRLVPLRHTHVVSMLVERRMVVDVAPPNPSAYAGYAGTEWTARLFKRHPGALVPASRVPVQPLRSRSLLPALRVVRTGTWRRGETLRELAGVWGADQK